MNVECLHSEMRYRIILLANTPHRENHRFLRLALNSYKNLKVTDIGMSRHVVSTFFVIRSIRTQ